MTGGFWTAFLPTSAFLGGAGGLSASPAWTSVGSQAGAASGAGQGSGATVTPPTVSTGATSTAPVTTTPISPIDPTANVSRSN